MICPSAATVFGRAGALPSLYRRTAGPEFDKSPKKILLRPRFKTIRILISASASDESFVSTAESTLAGITAPVPVGPAQRALGVYPHHSCQRKDHIVNQLPPTAS